MHESSIIRVLLLEDNQADARLIGTYLQTKSTTNENELVYDIHQVVNLATAEKMLAVEVFDIILCDLNVTDSDGLETFARLFSTAESTPIIILSGLNDEKIALTAVQNGAQDYIHKTDLSPSLLTRSIRYAIERHRLAQALQKQTKKLASSEAQRRAIVAKNPDGIVILNKKGIVRFINPAAEKILGKSRVELLGELLPEIPLTAKENNEFFIERKNGALTIIEFHLVDTEWDEEPVFQASLRDITEHHRIRQELSRKAAELVNQNTALDAFASTTAHQIQGLLAQMVGYASILQMHFSEEKGGDERTAADRIVQSGHKMNNVISELLLLASIRDTEVQLIPLDMSSIVAEALKRLRYEIEQSAPQIDLPDSLPIGCGYNSWIEEVWVNYINNALKFGGNPPVIKIGASKLSTGMVKFWVKDNGQGISAADQKQLFKPHTRIYNRKVKGEGLGLSIVRQIVNKCGGEVGVESEPGNGSLFWFSLKAVS